MTAAKKFDHPYNVCAIDVGSPKRKSIGWCFIDFKKKKECTGPDLDKLIPLIVDTTKHNGLILGFEAPIIIPVRDELKELTSARVCDGRYAWSGSAGAIVSVINIPIMRYVFNGIKKCNNKISFLLNEKNFKANKNQIMIYEAFVSGKDKLYSGSDKQYRHILDAKYMARSCAYYAKKHELPPTVLEPNEDTEYFNFAAATLLRCGLKSDTETLNLETPIYKPTQKVLKNGGIDHKFNFGK